MNYNAIIDTGCNWLQSCMKMEPGKVMQPTDKIEIYTIPI